MRRSSLLLSAIAVVFAGSTALAQAKPNFTGKWTITTDSATVQVQGISAGGGEMGGLGTDATIEMTDKTMIATRMTPMGELKSVFNLDGTETHSSVEVQGQSIPLTMKTRWENSKLITSTWANIGQPIEIILNFWLDDKGNLMTEHVLPAVGNGMNGGTVVTKYKKAS